MDTTKFEQLATPCFILDEKNLEESVVGFRTALSDNFTSSILGYSVKTNSFPYLIKKMCEMGVYPEVVSHDEYQLAKRCGASSSHIIYNGPMKSKETFLEAIQNNAIVNIETKRELSWLHNLPQNEEFHVGIRLNINISRVSKDDADGDNDNSRFGFSDETKEFSNAIEYIKQLPNITLSGLHIHRTTHSRSVQFYKRSIEYAAKTIKKYNLRLDYLDVGGGYFGIFKNKPTYQDYSDAFYSTMKEYGLENMTIIVEPGNALIASPFSFLSEVIDTKNVENDLHFITTDGSRNDIDPFFKKSDYIKDVLYNSFTSKIVKEQIITGCTCLEYDRMFTLNNSKLLKVGDRILYKNVGAYTMCLSPLFIRYIPNVYLLKDGQYTLIREKWTENEYIQKSKI